MYKKSRFLLRDGIFVANITKLGTYTKYNCACFFVFRFFCNTLFFQLSFN